ncbi:hypothetical protein AAFF_G00035760 [Aldrovandia affinis]|uniref:Uncharacterized protein n=1 Tax=Aldrovandia affinis TaxID=143900 RepID=A0AAD7S3A9_9TELE|nr:hypothetical protein AAFF_G00035760 [Aldrovandia affinis]
MESEQELCRELGQPSHVTAILPRGKTGILYQRWAHIRWGRDLLLKSVLLLLHGHAAGVPTPRSPRHRISLRVYSQSVTTCTLRPLCPDGEPPLEYKAAPAARMTPAAPYPLGP